MIKALNSCNIFHFAGHGNSHRSDPLRSHLFLEDWQEEQLTLADLLETQIPKHPPLLAYLSACSTGQVQDETMLDEGLHLANAFQMIGFQHVIGTLWDVEDETCREVASDVYSRVLKSTLSRRSVCRLSLYAAVNRLRDEWRNHECD